MDKYKGWLLVSDMDATLLSDEGTVSENNRSAINDFIAEGGLFTVASGRMTDAVRTYLDMIPINAPAVLHNGSKLYDFKNEKILYERHIEDERKQAVRRVHDERPDIGIEIYPSDETVYIYRSCIETSRFLTKSYRVEYSVPDAVWEMKWLKALFIGEREVIDAFEPIYRSCYDNGTAVRSGDRYLDMVANGSSKGSGVAELARLCGIPREQVICVGDNMNDLDMIASAGYGWAVANAEPEVKRAAKGIAPDNNSDAIAYVINNLGNEKR